MMCGLTEKGIFQIVFQCLTDNETYRFLWTKMWIFCDHSTVTWHSSCNVDGQHESHSEAYVDGQGPPEHPFTEHRLGHWTTSKELGHRQKEKEKKTQRIEEDRAIVFNYSNYTHH